MDLEALKKSFLKKFQEDTADRLQKIQLGVLDLEKPDSGQAAEAVARELHTMKGEARILGLSAIGQLAHAAEDLLKSARDGKTAVRIATDLLLRACDAVTDLLPDTAGAKNGTPASEEMCRRLAEVSGHEIPPLKPGRPAPRPAHVISGDEPLTPVVPPPLPGAARPEPPRAAPPQEPVPASAEAAPEPQVPKLATTDRSIRVNVEILDQMGTVAGDLLVESARARLRFNELNEILERFSRMGDRFLKVGERLNDDEVGKRQVEILERDLHLLRDDAFRSVRQHLDGLNSLHGNLAQLADDVAEARLVPLSTVFDAFPRAVREMAHQQGKEVELVVENPNVGVDRSMLSDVRDALVHLLRNAVDHGLEGPELRETLGKSRAGKLHIRVRADGDMLHLEVADDGRGIDPDKVKAAAVARKLISGAQAGAMGQREALELIFLSGLSTREEVSELSGRGVGMDVVKRKVESLGGSVALSSRLGRGTTISLRLPQTLALMRVLLVRLGGDVYG
ncbi:MAG TPA: ATP-binding protein, partial [Myxococcaceae bacterium]|nr:ATP-binding protein [Myxococcaceae bacterium]